MKILLTNDDGIAAPGLAALARAVGEKHKVFVVAPDTNRSACGHSITMGRCIAHKETRLAGSVAAYSVSGTPADCVKYASLDLFRGSFKEFDLVLSGINSGPNIGTDVMYSGTVSAAFEGAYMGVKGLAVSYTQWDASMEEYMPAANFVADNLEKLVSLIPHDGIITINYPPDPKGYKFTRIGLNIYDDYYETHGVGKQLKGETIEHDRNHEDCDVEWIKDGYITISPATMDRTDYKTLEKLQGIKLL